MAWLVQTKPIEMTELLVLSLSDLKYAARVIERCVQDRQVDEDDPLVQRLPDFRKALVQYEQGMHNKKGLTDLTQVFLLLLPGDLATGEAEGDPLKNKAGVVSKSRDRKAKREATRLVRGRAHKFHWPPHLTPL